MLNIKLTIKDSIEELCEFKNVSQIDALFDIDGFIDLQVNGQSFTGNYLKSIEKFSPNLFNEKSKFPYLIFAILWGMIEFLKEPDEPLIYIGDDPMITEFVLKTEGDKIEIFIHNHGQIAENVQEHWFDGESIFNGTQIPSSSATSVSKSELIDAIKSCLVNFSNYLDTNYKKLKENEEVKYCLIEIQKVIGISE